MHLCEKRTVRWPIAFSDAAGRQKCSARSERLRNWPAPRPFASQLPGCGVCSPDLPLPSGAGEAAGREPCANLSSLPLPSPWAQLFSDRRTSASFFSESFWLHRVIDNICQQIHLLKKLMWSMCVCVCVSFLWVLSTMLWLCVKVYEMIQRLLDISQELPLGSKLNLHLFYD